MIELKITGDACEVKKEIENLFNNTTASQQVLSVALTSPGNSIEGRDDGVELTVELAEEHTEEAEQVLRERDNRGFLWDSRLPSPRKTMNKEGTWRNKKGVDPILLEQSHIHI